MNDFQLILNEANKCLNCKNPQCVNGCPIKNPIPEILKLIKEEKIENACKLLFENTNASIICSKLCNFDKQCVGHCILNKRNNPVLFNKVEEYLSKFYENNFNKIVKNKEKIAIIGTGISGISIAIDLSLKGYIVEMYEALDEIGGVLTDTIPEFRFNKEKILDYKKILEILDVKIFYNKIFGENLFLEDLNVYKMIVLAMGTTKPKKTLGNSIYLLNPLDVLRKFNNNKLEIKNKKVLVIGLGNVALDVARVVRRSGNDTTIVYRRDIKSSPASNNEIIDAKFDGVKFIECMSPVELILENNKLKKLKVEQMNLVDTGELRKSFVKTGIFKELEADLVVEAIGLDADYKYLQKEIPELFNNNGWINDKTYAIYKNQIVIATGDYLTGASSFANAAASAKKTLKILEDLL